MSEMTIICPICYQPLTKDNTGELGYLQPECNDCRKKLKLKPDIIERYAKLLEFIKDLSDILPIISNDNIDLKSWSVSAKTILREVGE